MVDLFLGAVQAGRPVTAYNFDSWLGSEIKEILDSEDLQMRFATAILDGVTAAGLSTLFDGRTFDIDTLYEEFRKAKNSRTYDFQSSGIYMIICHFSARNPTIYIGKTKSFVNRRNLYNGDLRALGTAAGQNKNVHLRTLKDATSWAMHPLCYLSSPTIATLAEQFFTCLFQTYCREVLDLQSVYTAAQRRQIIAQNANASTSEGQYSDGVVARQFRDLGRQMALKLLWTNSVDDLDFGCSGGTNWLSPLAESGSEKRVWTVVRGSDRDFYSTASTQIKKSSPRPGEGIHAAGTGLDFKPAGAYSTEKEENSKMISFSFDVATVRQMKLEDHRIRCYTTFEIMHEGKVHPRQFGSLFHLGGWSDWDKCRRLGVQVHWIEPDTGRYRSVYLCRKPDVHGTKPLDRAVPQSTPNYAVTSALVSFFLNEDARTGAGTSWPAWRYSFGSIRLKEVSYNFLDNEIRISLLPFGSRHISVPTLQPQTNAYWMVPGRLPARSPNVVLNYNNINRVNGYTKVGGEFRAFLFGEDRTRGKTRTKCDTCYLLQYYSGNSSNAKCIKAPAPNDEQCTMCLSLGRQCTWTSGKLLSDNQQLADNLLFPLQVRVGVETKDPGFIVRRTI